MNLFLDTCMEERPEYYQLFYTAVRAGLRHGELIALEWGDIDWNKKTIYVCRKMNENSRKIEEFTKSRKNRSVDISDDLFIVLKELYTMRKMEAIKEGRGDNIVEIIFHRNGGYLKQRNNGDIFKKILRTAGIRDRRVHDCRHTYGSLLLSTGASPVYVKELMGHSTISITVDIYGKWIKSNNRSEVNKLDDALNRTLFAPSNNMQVAN
ncbi:site-specific integrase [Candidatus Latescibacterota bacterium]